MSALVVDHRRICLIALTFLLTDVYYLAFPNDRLVPKLLVSFVYLIEVLQTVLATKDAFRNFGTGWGNMIDLDAVGLLWFSVPFLGSISKRMFLYFLARNSSPGTPYSKFYGPTFLCMEDLDSRSQALDLGADRRGMFEESYTTELHNERLITVALAHATRRWFVYRSHRAYHWRFLRRYVS